MTINYKKTLILIVTLFFTVIGAFGGNAYKNELIKVGFTPLGVNDVKVTLYTSKPYSEPLRLLRKNDSEFVLILPETYNSAPQKPSISDVIGEVTDADIKLYSFISNAEENGYTKIVIRTNGSINLYPESVAIGGGRIANNEVNKIISSQIKPTPKSNVQTPQIKPSAHSNVNTQTPKIAANTVSNKEVKQPQKTETQNTVKTQKTQPKDIKQNKQEPAKNAEKPVIKTDEPPIFEPLPNLGGKYTPQSKPEVVVPLEEIPEEVVNVSTAEQKNETVSNVSKVGSLKVFLSKDKNKTYNYAKKAKHYVGRNLKHPGGIALILAAIMFAGLSIKFALAVIKSAKPKTDEEITAAETADKVDNGEYSSFFKTLIDSEVKGSNAFQLSVPSEDELSADLAVEPLKTHKEVMNIDQNLSWQEKFRAVQKNKKALFREDDTENTDYNITSETEENMHIENPIKKLKQDFKAVRKVLEKQKDNKTYGGDAQIEQNFVPEKIDKVEVISFEDYRKDVNPPKIQLNATMPMKSNPPKVVSQLPLANEKGFYLIDYNDKIALIGYIKDKVFKLNTYSNVRDTKLYARLTESSDDTETYIVKFDNNKMVVDVVDEKMQLKLIY